MDAQSPAPVLSAGLHVEEAFYKIRGLVQQRIRDPCGAPAEGREEDLVLFIPASSMPYGARNELKPPRKGHADGKRGSITLLLPPYETRFLALRRSSVAHNPWIVTSVTVFTLGERQESIHIMFSGPDSMYFRRYYGTAAPRFPGRCCPRNMEASTPAETKGKRST